MAIAAFTAGASTRSTNGTWAALASGDTGAPVEVDASAVVTVQCTGGTFAGQTLTWEASLDGANWAVCSDIKGTAMTLTAPGLLGVGPAIRWIRPNLGGAGATGVTCALVAARWG